jgi:hypothetical protein
VFVAWSNVPFCKVQPSRVYPTFRVAADAEAAAIVWNTPATSNSTTRLDTFFFIHFLLTR